MISKLLQAQLSKLLRSAPHLLPTQAHILIAVSGGQDSLCLAQLLRLLQSKWQWQLAIAHCDHQWRVDSTENALHVQELAKNWNLPFYLRTAEIALTNEARAREWRYAMLGEMARLAGCKIIVTGHTRSDRAETLLYNLVRGSGTDGLQSLSWQRSLGENLILARPLLEISREQTLAFCEELHLPIWQDSTNENLNYRRNRIRQELLPYLAEHFNPQVEIALSHTAELLHADVMYLEQLAREAWQLEELPRIDRLKLRDVPKALQRRIIRQFLNHYLPHPPNFAQIEKVGGLIIAPNRDRCDPLSGGMWAEVEHPWIWLRDSNFKSGK